MKLRLERHARPGMKASIRFQAGAAWVVAATAAVLLAGCASSPPAPDWQLNAYSAVQRASSAYLEGNSRVADAEWERARSTVRRTGQADVLARVELTRCAVQLASLAAPEPWACPAFNAIAQDAGPAEQAYARYLAGKSTPADVTLLPQVQQPLARVVAEAQNPNASVSLTLLAKLRAIPDPLSRLVATAALLQRLPAEALQPVPPLDLAALAIDTASAQGWQRPLLAWLALQEGWASRTGNNDLAEQARRRMALVQDQPPR